MITLHCGLHKTGSSSIQFALQHYARGRAVMVPRPGEDQSDGAWLSRLEQLARHPEGVLSDEKLLGSPFDGYRQAHERAELVSRALAGREFRIVVYLRPQIDWLPSVYLQGVQEGRPEDPDEFWARLADEPLLKWGALLDILQNRTGAAQVVARAFGGGRDAVADFLGLCGVRVHPGMPAIAENVSIAPIQAPLLLALNRQPGITASERARLRDVFQSRLRPGAPSGWSAFPESVVEQVRARTLADWESVTARVSSTDPVEGERFAALVEAWARPALPFPGTALEGLGARQELLRSVRVLAIDSGPRSRPLAQRLRAASRRAQRVASAGWSRTQGTLRRGRA